MQDRSCNVCSVVQSVEVWHRDFLSSDKNHRESLFRVTKTKRSPQNFCAIMSPIVHAPPAKVPRAHKASTSHMQCRLLRGTQSACHAACQPLTQSTGALEQVESDFRARRQQSTGMPDSVSASLNTSTGELHGARRTPAPDAMQHTIHRLCPSGALPTVTRSLKILFTVSLTMVQIEATLVKWA